MTINVITLPDPAWLVPVKSTPLNVPACQFGGHRSYGNGDISSCVSCYMDTSRKAELTALITIIRDFESQEYRFVIRKSQTRLAEKQEGKEEEYMQLQSVMRFT